jgi:hypothetical protein
MNAVNLLLQWFRLFCGVLLIIVSTCATFWLWLLHSLTADVLEVLVFLTFNSQSDIYQSVLEADEKRFLLFCFPFLSSFFSSFFLSLSFFLSFLEVPVHFHRHNGQIDRSTNRQTDGDIRRQTHHNRAHISAAAQRFGSS